jgi:hypothetical protein
MKERSLNLQELLVEIDNGSVTSTKQLDFQTKSTVHNNPYLISGNSFQDSKGLVTNKNNLKLTKKGEEMVALGKLTLKDIDNSYGKDSKWVWLGRPLAVAIITLLISVPLTIFLTYQINKHYLVELDPLKQLQECKQVVSSKKVPAPIGRYSE